MMSTLEVIGLTERLVQQSALPLLELALDQSERLAEAAGISLSDALAIQVVAICDVSEQLHARLLRMRREAKCRSR